jgi:regulator of nucleoside diphosphate kinase
MNSNTRIVNKEDRRRLQDAIQAARSSWRTYAPYLDWLTLRLEQATAVDAAQVPGDVVTMDSRVELADFRTGRYEAIALVYPDAPKVVDNAVSIFEPAGLALLGGRVGEIVTWQDEGASRTARIARLSYQPEASVKE